MANIKISELNPLLTVEDADVLPIVDNGVTKKVTAAILRSYTQGNSVLLTGAQTVAGIKTFTSQLASTVATGTAPFSVASTTKVTNLNADLLDGLSSADFQATLSGTGIVKSTAGTISYLTDNTANWDTAYNDKINSAAVTGSGTNTLTLTQQDAGTITATWVNGTLIREVRNTTGATLTKGTIVYISGATGNKPTVTKAIATGDSTSAQTFGFIQSDLANNDNGYVVVVGDLTGVDTSAFAEGAQLYLSSTVAGTFTDVKQYAPAHLVYVGIVTRSHPTLGQIEVNIQNGYELDELHNVSAQSPSNGDILQFVTSTGLWTKVAGTTTNISEGTNLYFTNARSRSAISLTTTGTSGAATYNSTTGVLNVPNYADGGITSLNGLTALSQTFAVGTSGTDFGISSSTSTHTFNLPTASATNRGALSSADWTTFNNKQNALTNPITGTGTTNYLPKFTGTSALGNSIVQDNGSLVTIGGELKVSTADANLNLQGTTKSYVLQVVDSNNKFRIFDNTANVERFSIATGGAANFSSSVTAADDIISTNGTITSILAYSGTYGGVIGTISNHNANIYTNGTPKLTINTSGNVGIGTTSPAYLLDVNGTGRFTGASTGAYLLLNAPSSGGTITMQADGVSFADIGSELGNFGTGSATNLCVSARSGKDLILGGGALKTLTLTSSGLVGIGTTSPNRTLSVNGQIGLSDDLIATNSTNVSRFGYNAYYSSSGFNLTTENSIPLTFGTASAERMRITSAGNVLIGTTTDAGYKLDVNGTARVSGAYFSFNNNGYIRGDATGWLQLQEGTNGFRVVSSDNGTPYLTIVDSSGAATFSSSVTANGTGGSPALNIRATDTNFALASILGNQTGDVNWLLMSGYPNAGDFTIRQSDTINALTIKKTTGNATFAGRVNIGNPVTAAVAVASTHKVEISIGGTTYYLLATT